MSVTWIAVLSGVLFLGGAHAVIWRLHMAHVAADSKPGGELSPAVRGA